MPIACLVLDVFDFRRLRARQLVFLELTPSSGSNKSMLATAQLVVGLHGLISASSLRDRLLRHKKSLSVEVVSTRAEGIRYVVSLDRSDEALFKQLIVSYLPDIKLRKVKDYLTSYTNQDCQILEFKQSGHFAYRLAELGNFNQHDPIAYIAGSMTKPLPDELIALQLVLSPASIRMTDKVRRELLSGKDSSLHRKFWHYLFIVPWKMVKIVGSVFRVLLIFLGEKSVSSSSRFGHVTNPSTQHVIDTLNAKLDEPLFNVDIRAIVSGAEDSQRAQGLINSLYQFRVPGYQGLVVRRTFPKNKMSEHRLNSFHGRLPAMLTRNSSVLAASEVASLYHFPYGETAQTENLVQSFSKTLPAPVSIKRGADNNEFDVMFGVNRYQGSDTPIGLTAAERERHVYILGGTGNGKTTLLLSAIIHDMEAGKGVAVIDPHGDLVETLLRYVPEDRTADVIYFNPSDIAHPIGLNILEQPKGLSDDELLLEQDFITEAVVSVFRKIFSDDDSGGHRIEHFLRNAIHTAFTVEDATLFTVYKLLTNTAFRRSVVANLEDEELKDFWAGEFNSAGDYQKVKMSGGVNAKLGRFQRSVVSRRILEQPKSTIDFDDIIQNHKILICNFSKGQIGEDTSALLGISVLAKLQLAALRRSRLGERNRSPFYLYVDEFQNFATVSFVQLLSEARKYRLYLTMAEQSTAQQNQRLVDIMLANVGTVICFRSGSPVDEKLLLPLFKPFIDRGDIANLPAFSFYMRIRAVANLEPLSGETLLLESDGSEEVAERVIAASRSQYAITYVALKKEVKEERVKGKASDNNTGYIIKHSNGVRRAVGRSANRRKTISKAD